MNENPQPQSTELAPTTFNSDRSPIPLGPDGSEELLPLWEQWPDEPPEHYSRFLLYVKAGPSRKLVDAYREWLGPERLSRNKTANNYGITPALWYELRFKWQWDLRAAAYDQNIIRKELAEQEEARKIERQKRRDMYAEFGEQLRAKIPDLEAYELTWRDAPAAIRAYAEGSRDEYDDKPPVRVSNEITVKFVEDFTDTVVTAFLEINSIPDELQRRAAFADKLREIGNAVAPQDVRGQTTPTYTTLDLTADTVS